MKKMLAKSLKLNAIKQQGFTLIELMIGLVIGLIAVLVIVQVFGAFEGQKRTTTGTSDAQTSGTIGLYQISREIQSAGYGLPIFDGSASALNCPIDTKADHDGVAGNPEISINPITITNGVTRDTITVRYGDASAAGIPVTVLVPSGTLIGVPNNIGCVTGDTALIARGSACLTASVTSTAAQLTADPTHVSLSRNSDGTTTIITGDRLSCIGVWNEYIFSSDGTQLLRQVSNAAAEPVAADIVNIQAQYGISADVLSNQVSRWVDATGDFANTTTTPTIENRKLIKAVRIAVVARNNKIENEVVTTTCSARDSANPTGLCAWAGTATSLAPAIDLTTTANWNRYRYRVFETVIPLRNMVWNLKSL